MQKTDILNNLPPGNYILSVSNPLGFFNEKNVECYVFENNKLAIEKLN